MASEELKVELAQIEPEDQWEEKSKGNSFGEDPQARWFKTYDVYLNFQNTDKGLVDFFLHFTVCSPAMRDNPPEKLAKELSRALEQEKFDEDEAENYLRECLRNVVATSMEDLRSQLSKFLYILPESND